MGWGGGFQNGGQDTTGFATRGIRGMKSVDEFITGSRWSVAENFPKSRATLEGNLFRCRTILAI